MGWDRLVMGVEGVFLSLRCPEASVGRDMDWCFSWLGGWSQSMIEVVLVHFLT